MPLNILGQDGQPSIGEGGHLWFVGCQVSTYHSIGDAAPPLTGGDAKSAAYNLSSALFGDSPGHAHFLRSHLLVPLQVTRIPSYRVNPCATLNPLRLKTVAMHPNNICGMSRIQADTRGENVYHMHMDL